MITKEFVINNLSQFNTILIEIQQTFESAPVDSVNVIVKFTENIVKSDFLECLKQLWQYEINSGHTLDILIKNLSYDYRKEALGYALKTPQLRNPIFLQNVFCLIKGYNTFEEAYFEHEQVFLNDEVEFLDIFDDLEEEIKHVTYQTAEYYVSMLKTCNLVEAVENNPNAVEMEDIYIYLFNSMDVTILAKVLSSVKDTTIWETKKVVLNSLGYLGKIAEKFIFTNTVMDLIGAAILEKTSKSVIDNKE
jgi:hypothetical protein